MASPPPIGDNGPPAYETRSDIPDGIVPLDWFKCSAKDVLDDMLKLPLDERGFYATAWLAMYHNMEMLPADDRMAAHRLAMDVRSYRSYLDKLLSKRSETSGLPLLYRRPSGRISNHRYEKEITEYVEGAKKRREAAAEREAKRKAAKQTPAPPASSKPKTADTSAGDVRGMSGGSGDIPRTLTVECPDNRTSIVGGSSEKIQQKQDEDSHGSATALPEARQASATDIDIEREREKKKGRGSAAAGAALPSHYEAVQAFEMFNAVALKVGIPQARTLTSERRQKLLRRLAEHGGLEAWKIAMGKLEKSGWCQGRNARGWRADFEFVLAASSFNKLIEGAYDDTKTGAANSPDDQLDRIARIVADSMKGEAVP